MSLKIPELATYKNYTDLPWVTLPVSDNSITPLYPDSFIRPDNRSLKVFYRTFQNPLNRFSQRAEQNIPLSAEDYLQAGLKNYSKGPEFARQCFFDGLRIANHSHTSEETKAQLYLNLGEICYEKTDYISAGECFQNGLTNHAKPETLAELWTALSDVYQKSNKLEQASTALEKADHCLSSKNRYFELRSLCKEKLAFILYDLDRWPEAVNALEQGFILVQEPHHRYTMSLLLIKMYRLVKRRKDAKELCSQVLKQFRTAPMQFRYLGILIEIAFDEIQVNCLKMLKLSGLTLEQKDIAIAVYEKIVKMNDINNTEFNRYFLDEAFKQSTPLSLPLPEIPVSPVLQRIEPKQPPNTADEFLQIGMDYLGVSNYQTALNYFQQGLNIEGAIDETKALLCFFIGGIYYKDSQFDLSINVLYQGLFTYPNTSQFTQARMYGSMGSSYFALTRWSEAEWSFTKADIIMEDAQELNHPSYFELRAIWRKELAVAQHRLNKSVLALKTLEEGLIIAVEPSTKFEFALSILQAYRINGYLQVQGKLLCNQLLTQPWVTDVMKITFYAYLIEIFSQEAKDYSGEILKLDLNETDRALARKFDDKINELSFLTKI